MNILNGKNMHRIIIEGIRIIIFVQCVLNFIYNPFMVFNMNHLDLTKLFSPVCNCVQVDGRNKITPYNI